MDSFGDAPLKFGLARGGQYTVAVSVLEAVSRHVRAAPRPAGQIAVVVVAVVAVEQRPGGLGVFESRRLHLVVEGLCFAVGIPVCHPRLGRGGQDAGVCTQKEKDHSHLRRMSHPLKEQQAARSPPCLLLFFSLYVHIAPQTVRTEG